MRKSAQAESHEVLVYDGRHLLGTIFDEGDRYVAVNAEDRRLGVYLTSREAYQAIIAAARSKSGGHQ